jgi:hypothetical protein
MAEIVQSVDELTIVKDASGKQVYLYKGLTADVAGLDADDVARLKERGSLVDFDPNAAPADPGASQGDEVVDPPAAGKGK